MRRRRQAHLSLQELAKVYLPPDRGYVPALNPTKSGTRFIVQKGWKAELLERVGGNNLLNDNTRWL